MDAKTIGVRLENKSVWERRTPLVPQDILNLRNQGIDVVVQASPNRAFADTEFQAAGIPVQADLDNCEVILGIKEIPWHEFRERKTYLFFAHVIKGQIHNMPMLRRLLALNTTLIDYEKITDEYNQRLIFFGRHAGLAGMLNSFWALGQRLLVEGIANPFDVLRQAREYANLTEALKDIDQVAARIQNQELPSALQPLVTAFVGYGNVSRGAQEVFDRLPHTEIQPQQLPGLMASPAPAQNGLYKVVFKEEDCFAALDGNPFELADYYRHGATRYQSVFEPYLPHLTMLIHCSYWDARYPRIMPLTSFQKLWTGSRSPRLRVIGDISCDVGGSIEGTRKATDPGTPAYVYDPEANCVSDGFSGRGPVIMAVEILPTEIPRESSESFSEVLSPYIPALARANYAAPLADLALPPEIKRAIITHQGQLTPDYLYLQEYLNEW